MSSVGHSDVGGDPMPLLWLCGPPGVGKTSVGWELYRSHVDAGVDAGYVDIDQLGICYPEPTSDRGRHVMKARNLSAVATNFRAAGARCMVVSGVVDARNGVDVVDDPNVRVTVCRLRSDPDELRRRFLARGSPAEAADDVLYLAAVLDATTFADVVVDTTGLSIVKTVHLVSGRTGWPTLLASGGPSQPPRPSAAMSEANGTIVWLYGTTAVGKSTVGYAIFQHLRRAGVTTAYVDVDQLGFCSCAPMDHDLRAANLAALWQTCRDVGAEVLVAVGPLDAHTSIEPYVEALPAARFTWCGLHAEPDELTRRIVGRRHGGSWLQPGDPLISRSLPHLVGVAERAASRDAALRRMPLGLHVDTTTLDVDATADVILSRSLPAFASTRR